MDLMFRSTRALVSAALIFLPMSLSSCLAVEDHTPELIPIEETNFATPLGVNLAASTRTPNGAYYRDIVVGTGPAVVVGKNISVHYTAWLANGTVIQSNVADAPFQFIYGIGAVIDGWDEGLVGARVGGQRQLIVPPSLGYGEFDYGTKIPGNSVLVFNIEIVSMP
jgi:FKBP-type peptidyl-prolyl cis-trans isomerase